MSTSALPPQTISSSLARSLPARRRSTTRLTPRVEHLRGLLHHRELEQAAADGAGDGAVAAHQHLRAGGARRRAAVADELHEREVLAAVQQREDLVEDLFHVVASGMSLDSTSVRLAVPTPCGHGVGAHGDLDTQTGRTRRRRPGPGRLQGRGGRVPAGPRRRPARAPRRPGRRGLPRAAGRRARPAPAAARTAARRPPPGRRRLRRADARGRRSARAPAPAVAAASRTDTAPLRNRPRSPVR